MRSFTSLDVNLIVAAATHTAPKNNAVQFSSGHNEFKFNSSEDSNMGQLTLTTGSSRLTALFLFVAALFTGFKADAATPIADYLTEEIDFETHDGFPMFGKLVLPKSKVHLGLLWVEI